MRSGRSRRILVAVAAAAAVTACGGTSSPTGPDMPAVPIATGAQVLRITLLGQCPSFENTRGGFFPLVYARVTVTHSGNEWIARAASPDAGTVELRFRQSGPAVISGSMPIQGTIRGVAIHAPELATGVPPWNTRASITTDGTAVNGFAFAPSSLTPAAGTSGVGSGAIDFSDSDGHSCAGSTFSWTLAASP